MSCSQNSLKVPKRCSNVCTIQKVAKNLKSCCVAEHKLYIPILLLVIQHIDRLQLFLESHLTGALYERH